MKTILTLLMSASVLMALDDPTYPIHENGEYLCYINGQDGKSSECRLWLFGKRINENMVEAYRLKRLGRYTGGAVATTGGMPVGEYEKEPVILNLNQFSYIKLIRIHRPRTQGRSSLHNWTQDERWNLRWTNEVSK